MGMRSGSQREDSRLLRERDAALPWRVVLPFYALALTLGTHWPKLEIDLGGLPAPDKLVHLLAFGGLTVLLAQARLMPHRAVLPVALAWTLLDEITQALPILGRRFTMLDVIAGWMGVLIAVAWIWALAPLGGRPSRLRLAVTNLAAADVFLRFRSWVLLGLAGVGMAVCVGGVAGLLMWLVHPDGTSTAAIAGALAGGLGGAYGMLDALWRREHRRVIDQHRCAACNARCDEAPVGPDGWGACPCCDEPFHLGQWVAQAALSRSTLARLGTRSGAAALGLGVLIAVLYVVGIALYMRSATVRDWLGGVRRWPIEMRLVLDTTMIALICAVAARLFRRRMAAIIDRQGERCRSCGHDVHATQTERGIGRCPECGTPFMRIESSKTANAESAEAIGVDG